MMTRRLGPFTTWVVLVAGTLASYALGRGDGEIPARIAGAAVVIVAMTKAWLIGMRYMELDHAIRPLRMIYSGWVLIVGATLLAMLGVA